MSSSILKRQRKRDMSRVAPPSPIAKECDQIKFMLLDKQKMYGDSALKPLRLFSGADSLEQIRVRIDDKLSRILTSEPEDTEDTITDLIGYLILYKVALRG